MTTQVSKNAQIQNPDWFKNTMVANQVAQRKIGIAAEPVLRTKIHLLP